MYGDGSLVLYKGFLHIYSPPVHIHSQAHYMQIHCPFNCCVLDLCTAVTALYFRRLHFIFLLLWYFESLIIQCSDMCPQLSAKSKMEKNAQMDRWTGLPQIVGKNKQLKVSLVFVAWCYPNSSWSWTSTVSLKLLETSKCSLEIII